MNWIDYKEQLPEEGQVILNWKRDDAYDGGKHVASRIADAPYITRFHKKDFEYETEEGREPNVSYAGMEMYCYSVCWIPIPDLHEVYKECQFNIYEDM